MAFAPLGIYGAYSYKEKMTKFYFLFEVFNTFFAFATLIVTTVYFLDGIVAGACNQNVEACLFYVFMVPCTCAFLWLLLNS